MLFENRLGHFFQVVLKCEKLSGKRKTVSVRFLKNDVRESTWVDGDCYAIRLRPSAVPELSAFVLEYMAANPTDNRVLDASVIISEVLNISPHPGRSLF